MNDIKIILYKDIIYKYFYMIKRKATDNIFSNNKRVRLSDDKNMIYINKKIESIDDLIFIGEQYRPTRTYNINVKKFFKKKSNAVIKEIKNSYWNGNS